MRTAYLVAPEADAADAVQDAFVKAYAALGRFRDGAPAGSLRSPARVSALKSPAPSEQLLERLRGGGRLRIDLDDLLERRDRLVDLA